MLWRLTVLALAAGGAVCASLVVSASGVSASTAVRAHAAGVRLRIPASAEQLIVVSSPTEDPAPPGYLATLRAYQRDGRRSAWRRVFGPWQAETGAGHLVAAAARREGDGATPIGVFRIGPRIYGANPDPGGLHYGYHRLACGDWWDEDPYSAQYNRFVHVRCGLTPSFASRSEPLWTETLAYPYFAVLQFNTHPVVGGRDAPGSGIFLHSWIDGATEGCVALRERELLSVLRWLRPSAHPVIEIGTDAQIEVIRRDAQIEVIGRPRAA